MQNRIFRLILLLVTVTALVIRVSPTHAEEETTGGGLGIACPEGQVYIGVFDECLGIGTTISYVVNYSLIIGALLALVKFAVGAGQMVVSTGQPTKLENARATVTDSVLGFILIAAAWVLLSTLRCALPSEWQIDFFVLFGDGC